MVKYTLRAICIFIISLIVLGQMARADVTQNVTFTVKNNGMVEATSDIGTFTGSMHFINYAQMPSELLRPTDLVQAEQSRYRLNTPVGYNMVSELGPKGYRLPLSFRLKSLYAGGVAVWAVSGGSCDGGTNVAYGSYRINTDNKPFSAMGCDSSRGAGAGTVPSLNIWELYFSYMEDIGGKDGLSKMTLPAGTYTFKAQPFTFIHLHGGAGTAGTMYVKVTVVVEPSIASVNIPTALPLDVAVESGSRLTGQGSILATVTGTLGSNLKILPASANNGQLVKGAERIPYTLSVVPLSGDNKSRLLVDGNQGGAQPQVVIETNEKRDQYQFRFDASFATTLSNLSSGRFSDNVTLIFTTTDLP